MVRELGNPAVAAAPYLIFLMVLVVSDFTLCGSAGAGAKITQKDGVGRK